MSAEELVQWGTNLAFLGLFVLVGLNAVRERTRLAADAGLVFGALGAVILQGLVFRLLGIGTILLVQDLVILIVAALPYLTLRLAQDFSHVARWALWVSVAGAVALGTMAFATAALPGWTSLALAAHFIGFESYAGWAFARAARRTAGVTRMRLSAAAAGSLLLGLTVVVSSLRVAIPALGVISVQAFALSSAIAYFLAFSPPRLVRRAWRYPHLRAFLGSVTRASALSETAAGIAELERGIAAATGAEEVRIILGPPAGEPQRPKRDGAVLVTPIVASSGAVATVVVHLPRAHGFLEETRVLVELLAEQAAIVLEAARLRDEVRAASRAKSDFLANMSHELRTPLNAILGFSSLMRENTSLAADKRDRYLANITDAGEHLLALINDVLDLSTVEAGRIQLRPDRTTLLALVQPVVESARPAAERAGIAFTAVIRGSEVVRVDAQRIRQVLLNLLSNAVKFTPQGGSVRLLVAVEGADLLAEVADNGIGIPADRQRRIFAVFERVNEDRSEAAGTGLGLALTKRLVELHGGSLTFESAPGSGTTFHLRLPDAVVESMSGERVLVVEDEERDGQLICALATDLGLRCEVVTTVAGAREAVRREAPLGVVLDLRLPDGRGEQVLAAIRSTDATRRLPVAVVTVEDDAPAARALGTSLIVTKPIDVAVLSAWLASLRQPAPAQVAS